MKTRKEALEVWGFLFLALATAGYFALPWVIKAVCDLTYANGIREDTDPSYNGNTFLDLAPIVLLIAGIVAAAIVGFRLLRVAKQRTAEQST